MYGVVIHCIWFLSTNERATGTFRPGLGERMTRDIGQAPA